MSDLKTYIDGNNNCWEFETECIRYKAISKLMSSSGTYSGGTDKTIYLKENQQSTLDKLVENAIQDLASHSEIRTMGTALLQFNDRQIILKMQSIVKLELDDFFNELLILK
jgi:hypothetical protein